MSDNTTYAIIAIAISASCACILIFGVEKPGPDKEKMDAYSHCVRHTDTPPEQCRQMVYGKGESK